MKKTIVAISGLLLIVGTLYGGSLKNIVNWDTTEMFGYNIGTLAILLGGAYMAYWGLKSEKKK